MSQHAEQGPRALLGMVESMGLEIGFEFSSRPMFGGFFGYAEGRAFASFSNAGLGIKLDPAAQGELLDRPGARRLRYGPDEPESRTYVVLPDSILGDPQQLSAWLRRSAAHVASLPAKQRRGRQRP